MDNEGSAFAAIVIIGFYLLPGIIASIRKHGSVVAIWIVNIFLGWTVLGWFISLVWSFTSTGREQTIVHIYHDKEDDRRNRDDDRRRR